MNRTKVVKLFGTAGAASAFLSASILDTGGPSAFEAVLFLVGPGVAFALSAVWAFRLANASRLFGPEVVVQKPWGAIAVILLVASWPVSLFVMMGAIEMLGPPMKSDWPPVEPNLLQILVGDYGVEVSLFIGGFTVLLLLASSVRVACRRWPARMLLGSSMVAIGVPAVTVMVNSLLRLNFSAPVTERLFVPGPNWVQSLTLLVVGQGALGLLLGYWLFEGFRVAEKPAE